MVASFNAKAVPRNRRNTYRAIGTQADVEKLFGRILTLAGKMIQSYQTVSFAATECGLKPYQRIAASASQTCEYLPSKALQTLGRVRVVEKRGGITIYGRCSAVYHRGEVGGENIF
jgi:hypothetical protein